MRPSSEEVAPNMAAGGNGEVVIVHGDVDAGLEGRVDVVDAVGGEEEDALVVFQHVEKNCMVVIWRARTNE